MPVLLVRGHRAVWDPLTRILKLFLFASVDTFARKNVIFLNIRTIYYTYVFSKTANSEKKVSCHKQFKTASCPLPLFHFFHLLVPPLPPNVARACLQARKSSTRVCLSECNLVLLKVATSIYINC